MKSGPRGRLREIFEGLPGFSRRLFVHFPSTIRSIITSPATNLPADVDLKTLAATIKARWVCEQAHQQLKEELGLDHFEGRSWRGLHRHALMAMIAYAFLQHLRLAAASGEKRISAGPPSEAVIPQAF
jgi:SRSO17 transposase